MATIEYNGHIPSAWEDMQVIGSPQSGNGWYDDELPTRVNLSVIVNNSGNAAGSATLELRDVSEGIGRGIGDEMAAANIVATDTRSVDPAGADGTPGQQLLRVSYLMTNNALMDLGAFVIDDTTRAILAQETFTVNSYEIPRVSELQVSGTITIQVE